MSLPRQRLDPLLRKKKFQIPMRGNETGQGLLGRDSGYGFKSP